MTPPISDLIPGVIAKVVVSIVTSVASGVAKTLWAPPEESDALRPMLQKAAEAVAEVVEVEGPAREEVVCLFLTSPEAEAVVRQIFSAKLLAEHSPRIKSIKNVFLASFS